jgi:hypothetical protein
MRERSTSTTTSSAPDQPVRAPAPAPIGPGTRHPGMRSCRRSPDRRLPGPCTGLLAEARRPPTQAGLAGAAEAVRLAPALPRHQRPNGCGPGCSPPPGVSSAVPGAWGSASRDAGPDPGDHHRHDRFPGPRTRLTISNHPYDRKGHPRASGTRPPGTAARPSACPGHGQRPSAAASVHPAKIANDAGLPAQISAVLACRVRRYRHNEFRSWRDRVGTTRAG